MNSADTIISREAVLEELLDHCNLFVRRSSDWRRQSYEDNWRKWQNAADAIYDKNIASRKESWQSKAFVPITPSHRENAQGQLFKTEVGPRPPLEVKARPGIVNPENDQSLAIRDLILREREKCRYELHRNGVLEDKTTYGSGFARVRFETKYEDRIVRIPEYEPVSVLDPASIARAMAGQRQVTGYRSEVQQKVIYRGIRFEDLSIWDVFPDPKCLRIQGHSIAVRYYQTYGDIVEGVKAGWAIPEAIDALRDLDSEDITPEDKMRVEADREIAPSRIDRTEYQKNLICYELYGRLPKKWVLINGEPIDDPESLIPARVCFHKNTVICVEVNDSYDGEPPIFKDDYMPVKGQFYGRGIPEMLKDVQLVANETVNQRLDAASITLDPQFAVIEKAIVDPKDLDNSRAGGVIRLKNPPGMNVGDVKQVFGRVEKGTIDRAALIEPQEWERYAQERTSINRQTLGTAGQVKDANETLGGQQLLLQATGDKLAYLGMLSEFDFQYEVTRAIWKLIYANYQPEDYALALGVERAAKLVPMSPEEVENGYQYYPKGIFTMENKALRQARLAQILQMFGAAPWVNQMAFFDAMVQGAEEDPQVYKVPQAEAVQIVTKAQEMAQGMAQSMLAQMAPKPESESPEKPDAESEMEDANAK